LKKSREKTLEWKSPASLEAPEGRTCDCLFLWYFFSFWLYSCHAAAFVLDKELSNK
jgi:hypothetical protein